MSKETAKKNIKSNQVRILVFLLITAILNILFTLHVLYIDSAAWTTWEMIKVQGIFWLGQELIALKLLWSAGQPVYSPETGALVECVDISDAAQLGLLSYAQDLLWVCWAVQFLSQFVSRTAGMLYLAVPGYGAYKLWEKVISPFLEMRRTQRDAAAAANQDGGAAGEEPMDARSRLERRKQENKERQMNKNKKQ